MKRAEGPNRPGSRVPSDQGQVDHVNARANGGSGTHENGQILCARCNSSKRSKPDEVARVENQNRANDASGNQRNSAIQNARENNSARNDRSSASGRNKQHKSKAKKKSHNSKKSSKKKKKQSSRHKKRKRANGSN